MRIAPYNKFFNNHCSYPRFICFLTINSQFAVSLVHFQNPKITSFWKFYPVKNLFRCKDLLSFSSTVMEFRPSRAHFLKYRLHRLVSCNLLRNFPLLTPHPYAEGEEKPKKRSDYWRLVGGRLNRKGNLLARLVLGSCKINSFHSHQPES